MSAKNHSQQICERVDIDQSSEAHSTEGQGFADISIATRIKTEGFGR